jgi:hypothetical protein
MQGELPHAFRATDRVIGAPGDEDRQVGGYLCQCTVGRDAEEAGGQVAPKGGSLTPTDVKFIGDLI